MDPEELELQNDYRYRNYAAVIEKALRNFESSSEWADLISSLGKLIKVCNDAACGPHGKKRLNLFLRQLQHLPSGVCVTKDSLRVAFCCLANLLSEIVCYFSLGSTE